MIRKHLHRLGRLIEEAGGGDIIWDQIAAGAKMDEIMEPFINPDTGKPYHRSLLYQWIHRDPEREKAWKEARRQSAYAKADEAGEAIEELAGAAKDMRHVGGLPASEVTLLKQRVGYLQWLAGISNEEFKEAKSAGVNVHLDFGKMHLEALQAGNRPAALPAADITPAEVDYEIVPHRADGAASEFDFIDADEEP